jgi:hypothetical protein
VIFRLAFFVVLVALVLLAFRVAMEAGRGMTESMRARRRAGRPTGTREWDRRTDQVKRQLKGVPTPDEPRAEMVSWVESHAGVEAYVEPKTMMSPLSVVFVDGDGEWKRFPLAEDRFLRALAKERGIQVFDASRVGYPPRMRRGRPGTDPAS